MVVTASLSGTVIPSVTERGIIDGGKTLIITLTAASWQATLGEDNELTQALLNGLVSDKDEADGWNAVVVPALDYSMVARTSDRVATITFPQSLTYDISVNETISVIIPGSAVDEPGPGGTFQPATCSETIKGFIDAAAAHYNLPRWFIYAICGRESSFDPDAYNINGGYGLTQLTGSWYVGVVYPENLLAPDNDNGFWINNMGLNLSGAYVDWIDMNNVTPITDNAHRFDPEENLARFCSGYAAAGVYWARERYPSLDDNGILRALAYHWNHGIFWNYFVDPDYPDYLTEYDAYVAIYRPAVEAEDGVWDGMPNIT
jgi:hypothetical protein